MSLRDSQFGEIKVPLTWTAAVALVVAAVVAVALLLTDRRESFRNQALGATRGVADSVVAPVGDALSAPVRWTGAGIDAVRGYFFAISENRRLKAELGDMRQWRDVAIALKNENNRYRSLLGLKTDPPIPMVAARIVTDSRGPFADTRLANTGREAGVKPGNPVMSEYGLVGRVISVTDGASRVLMLTDAASRTPVMIDRTNARAILTGDGGPNPRLSYLRGQDPVREGDRILTSGDGGILPRGLPVGVAVKGLDGKWRVVLAADKGPIDFVRILLFQDFTQLVNRKELDQTPVPPPTPGAPATEAPAASPLLAGPLTTGTAAATAKPATTPVAPAATPSAPAAKPAPAATAASVKPGPAPVPAKPPAAAPASAPKPASAATPAKTVVNPAASARTAAGAAVPKPPAAAAPKPVASKPALSARAGEKPATAAAAAAPGAPKPAAHKPTAEAATAKPPAPKPAAKPHPVVHEEPPV